MNATAGSWRLALRMARADARRHRLRTVLAGLLVALPTAAAILAGAIQLGTPSGPQAALRRLPAQAQARIVATALPQLGPPLAQPPEGITGPLMLDTTIPPASASQIKALVPAADALHPYWRSGDLLVAVGGFDPFDDASVARVQPDMIVTAQVGEAPEQISGLLWPGVAEGQAPSDDHEVLLPRELADRLHVGVGDQVTAFGPPATGWMGVDGRIADAMAGRSRTYRISGISDESGTQLWSLPGWLSESITADSRGINNGYLLVGDEPLTWQQVRELNKIQVWAVSRHVLENYPPAAERYPITPDPSAVLAALIGLVMGGLLSAALLLFTLTPAFTVTAEQSQRTLGLAAAAGAAPRDLHRMISAQGVLVGLLGGGVGVLAGTIAGLVYLAIRFPIDGPLALFSWWLPPLGVLGAVTAGILAAATPARRVARTNVVRALSGRPAQPSAGRAKPGWTGLLLLAAGLALGVGSLQVEPAPYDPSAGLPTTAPLGAGLLVTGAFVLTITGALRSLNLVFWAAERLGARLAIGPRLALADARLHRTRAWPAAAAILVCALAASVLPVMNGSMKENSHDGTWTFAAEGHLLAAPRSPVSDGFDAAVLQMAAERLGRVAPVTDRHPIRSWSFRDVQPRPMPVAGHTCPEGQSPTLESHLSRTAEFACEPGWNRAGLSAPWMLGEDALVLTPDGMRASGLPGAEQAAEVLAAGGVVVNSATLIDDHDQVRVAVGERNDWNLEIDDPISVTTLPGAFIPRFGAIVAMTPETAAGLGLELPRLVGEFWQTEHPLGPIRGMVAESWLASQTNLVWMTHVHSAAGGLTLLVMSVLLIGLAVGATLISLALARTQSMADLATMAANGATPGFLRKFSLLQSGVLLWAGVPLGGALGVGLGAYWVAWQRQLAFNGEWRLTVVPWGQLLAIWAAITIGALVGALLIGRRLPSLVRRRAD